MRGQGFAHGGQRRAYQLFDGLPFQTQRRVVALQPRHIQQIDDQRMHALGLVAHGADGFLYIVGQRARPARQRVGHADQAGERCAQVMRHRRQQRVAQPFRFHADQRLLRHLDVVQPFQGNGDKRGVGFDLAARIGMREQAAAGRGQGQHAACAHRRFQGQIQQFAVGQRGGARAGGLAVVIHPLGQRRFQGRHVGGSGRGQLQAVVQAQDIQRAT
ncbi:hypothetical protein D3C71_1386630 [compost metagenome]